MTEGRGLEGPASQGIGQSLYEPPKPIGDSLFFAACGGNLDPAEADTCGPLSWLRSAIDTLNERAVMEAASGDDLDAYCEMVREVRLLHTNLTHALAKARGEPPIPESEDEERNE